MAFPSITSCSGIVLPSLHEILPEHISRIPMGAPALTAPFVPAPPTQNFSFDVLRSNSRDASIHRLAYYQSSASSGPSTREDDPPIYPDQDDEAGAGEGKKHICRACAKRFNRPSSLRIHANTHTGATPFKCPYPGCGRAFNVNSNMRRHLRNHGASVFAPPEPLRTPASSAPPSPPVSPLSPALFLPHPAFIPPLSPLSPAGSETAWSAFPLTSRSVPSSPEYAYRSAYPDPGEGTAYPHSQESNVNAYPHPYAGHYPYPYLHAERGAGAGGAGDGGGRRREDGDRDGVPWTWTVTVPRAYSESDVRSERR